MHVWFYLNTDLNVSFFSEVNDTLGFYQWMNQTFIPANYPEKTYSGAELDILQKQMFGDLASIRVGPARIRQVRMPERT